MPTTVSAALREGVAAETIGITNDASPILLAKTFLVLGVRVVLGSESEARQLVLSVLPEPGTRQKCLMVFADAMEEANRHCRDVWAVRHTTEKVRLIVGHVIVCTLKNRFEHGPIWMALDKGLVGTSKYPLERSGDWEWDNDRYPEYRTIESRNGYYSPSEGHAELWDRIKPLPFESIGKAANQTTMDPRTLKGHTPEILNYIRKELGRQISDNPELCAF